MANNTELWFEDFRLDVRDERLWRGGEVIALSPKPFAVLRALVEHAGQLVTKETLLNEIWTDAVVGSAVLTVGIGELRRALGDNRQTPRFIETVPRRGYRFIAPVTTTLPRAPSRFPMGNAESGNRYDKGHTAHDLQRTMPLVGRKAELAQLHRRLKNAGNGERQLLFVTGEPGIGKTALVEVFLQQAATVERGMVGHGQCIEHYGTGEAYLPVLVMFNHLCRTPAGQRVREILNHYAPTWLAQMPALLDAAGREALQKRIQGTTRERMLREMAEALEALTDVRAGHEPSLLVLVLEDLHWSDHATLDLLSFLARRRHPARLFLIGTYRPADVTAREHPLRTLVQELQLHGLCEELPLGRLPVTAVEEYLALTFPHNRLPGALAHALHRRTGGNPLFLTKVVQDWVSQGVLGEEETQWELRKPVEEATEAVPHSLRQMIAWQLEKLSPQQQVVLEAASVAGEEFCAALVSAAVQEEVSEVEAHCEALVRTAQILEACDALVWPDGSVTARYRFAHALYQQVLYEQAPAARRIRLHQQIGRRLETAYGEQTEEVTAELAVHFERGREHERALRYREQAARRALRRSAAHEAIVHLRTALRVLETLPATPEHIQQELVLYTLLAPALIAAKGYASPEVEEVYTRVRTLSQQLDESSPLFPVLMGMAGFHLVRAEYRTTFDLSEQLLRVAQHAQDPELLIEGHLIRGVVSFYLGEFVTARLHLEQSRVLYDPYRHQSHAIQYGQDPWVAASSFLAWTLWCLGYPEQALQRSRETLAYAQEFNHPLSLAFALHLAGILHLARGEPQAAYERAQAVIALAHEYGLPYWLVEGTFTSGKALIRQGRRDEGLAQIQQVTQARQQEGRAGVRPAQLAMLAEAYWDAGQTEEGLRTLAQALAILDRTGERYHAAEFYRLQGDLLLQQRTRHSAPFETAPPVSSAPNSHARTPHLQTESEACFLHAIEIARQQQAKSYELRATLSLARLWQRQGKRHAAHNLLSAIYTWFTEGFDTKDLQDAKTLLDELA